MLPAHVVQRESNEQLTELSNLQGRHGAKHGTSVGKGNQCSDTSRKLRA